MATILNSANLDSSQKEMVRCSGRLVSSCSSLRRLGMVAFSLPFMKEVLSSLAISTLHQLWNPDIPKPTGPWLCATTTGAVLPHSSSMFSAWRQNTGAHMPQWIWPGLLMRRWWVGRKSRSFCFFLPASIGIGFVLYFYFKEA